MSASQSNFSRLLAILLVIAAALTLSQGLRGQEPAEPVESVESAGPVETFYVQEYQILGVTKLPALEVEKAVYPFLGPGITIDDVEKARAALQKAYHEAGYQTVTVDIPEQRSSGRIVTLQVVENRIGRLRVKGSRFFLPHDIRKNAPSLAEGQIPNFNDVQRDIVALNRHPDRSVLPSTDLRPGDEPGTVDVDLIVQDKFPLHGSIELNNQYREDTSELRLKGSLSYSNLWQAGHTIGGSFQVAPQRTDDERIYSAYYLAGIPSVDWLSILLQGTIQESDVLTSGGVAVAGPGEVFGVRAVVALPGKPNFYQSLNFGIDYKDFEQNVAILGGDLSSTPITYYPLSLNYSASWIYPKHETALNAGVNWGVRGFGSSRQEFDAKRFNADGSFAYLRGDLSHTHDLPSGFQAFAKIQGQAADGPLINSEQYSGGGLGTARGYLESSALGDNAIFGSIELRSPSLLPPGKDEENEWRLYGFVDAGRIGIYDSLPDQTSNFEFLSLGVGSFIRLKDFLNGSLDLGFPQVDPGTVTPKDMLLTFRVWMEF